MYVTIYGTILSVEECINFRCVNALIFLMLLINLDLSNPHDLVSRFWVARTALVPLI